MFITFTIDTHKKKNKMVRFNTKRFNPANGWQKAINAKKRSFWQKAVAWRRSLREGAYKLGGQPAMF